MVSLANYNQRLNGYTLDFRKRYDAVMVRILTSSILGTQTTLLSWNKMFCVLKVAIGTEGDSVRSELPSGQPAVTS